MPDQNHQNQPRQSDSTRSFSHLQSGFFDDSKKSQPSSEHHSDNTKKDSSTSESRTFTASISSANQPQVKNNFIPATIILSILCAASLICAGIFLAQSISKSSTISVLESQKEDLEQRIIELQHSMNSNN